jgi:hypothetical protein
MTGRILRRKDARCSVLEMDQSARQNINRLGCEARNFLTAQNHDLWGRASGPDFLPRLLGGALILQRIGQPTKDAVILEDDGAHLAFMTCTALSLIVSNLDPKLRPILEQTIKLLAMCCPIEIIIPALPPIDTLPERFRTSTFVRNQYKSFEETVEGRRDVMLADALTLLRIFQQSGRPEDFDSLDQLIEVTEGLRTALAQVRTVASQ